ncbi:MAG TPA: peptidoglycan DD-metalloendopeptidase family protein [Legionella sp.]|nr:peptidoglycan DD-metalloendopeptidase family protein [Legionella sp.]
MAQRPNIPKRQSGKPSKLLTACALVIAFSLPYLLVKNFSHHSSNDYTHQSLSLPKLAEGPSITQPNTDESEEELEEEAKVVKDNEWQIIKPRPGDSMAAIFHRLGLTAKNLHEVLDKNPHAKALTSIKPSQELQFLISKNKLEKLIIPVSNTQSLTVYKAGQAYKTQIDSKKMISHDLYLTATVNGSLYNTAQRLNIPAKLIRQMTEILGKEIDFSRAIRAGDQFSIVYEAYYIEDKMVSTGDILAVTYKNRGKSYQAIRHTNSQGEHDYFSPNGTSLKKAFSRYPIKFSHISSTFVLSRYHPILHYKRAHKGIDLAAPIGTPIQATGDGVITIIDRHNGYGNMIKIKHDKTFSTVYGHMLKFQKGLSKGSKVKRGQVIGYVGQTGLATGPHCHYELHVNNQPRNPTTTGLPTAAPVHPKEMLAFKAKTSTLLARLKLFEEAQLASKGRKNIDVG